MGSSGRKVFITSDGPGRLEQYIAENAVPL